MQSRRTFLKQTAVGVAAFGAAQLMPGWARAMVQSRPGNAFDLTIGKTHFDVGGKTEAAMVVTPGGFWGGRA